MLNAGAPRIVRARVSEARRASSAEGRADDWPSFNAIVPMACVDRRRHRGDGRRGASRAPASGCRSRRLGVDRPRRRRAAPSGCFWEQQRDRASASCAGGQLRRSSSPASWSSSACCRLAISAPTIDREGLPRGEYYALMLFAIGRHDADGDGHRPAASSSSRSRCCRWRSTC